MESKQSEQRKTRDEDDRSSTVVELNMANVYIQCKQTFKCSHIFITLYCRHTQTSTSKVSG